MGGPPNCPSDLCVCKDKGDTSKKWPPAKKVKPYDPSTVPTYPSLLTLTLRLTLSLTLSLTLALTLAITLTLTLPHNPRPHQVPTYRPLKGQGNDHQPPVKEGDEKPPAWKPGMGEQAIFSS